MRKAATASISNIEVVILAAYSQGAHVGSVDTEDIAVLANELAPGRFAWRKYRDQINLEHVRVALFDARKAEKGSLIEGNANDGWTLTRAGMLLAEELKERLASRDLSRALNRQQENRNRAWLNNERARMQASPIVKRVQSSGVGSISQREAEAFFRIDEYVKGDERERKLRRFMLGFELDPELGNVVTALAETLLAGEEK